MTFLKAPYFVDFEIAYTRVFLLTFSLPLNYMNFKIYTQTILN